MDILGMPGYDSEPARDPYATGPIRLRALLTTLSLIAGSTPLSEPLRPGRARFVSPRGAIELICDDPIALAMAVGTFAHLDDPDTPTPGPPWRITLARVRSLDAAPAAFIATPTVHVDHDVRARHHTSEPLGDSWWVDDPAIVIHHGPRSRWVRARYVAPAAARFWAPRLVGRVLTAQHVGSTASA